MSPSRTQVAGVTLPIVAAVIVVALLVLPPPGVLPQATGAQTESSSSLPAPQGEAREVGEFAFEPTLGVTSDGAILFKTFVEDPTFLGPGYRNVYRSTDQGATWTDVSDHVVSEDLDGDGDPEQVTRPPQSNDPLLHLDRDTDRVFSLDLEAAQCSTLAYSDDAGDSWTFNPIGCGLPPGVHDHPTLFTGPPKQRSTDGYPNLVYYCVNRVADAACAVSTDGGDTFGPLEPFIFTFGGLTGHGTTGPNGTVYLPAGRFNGAMVAISRDDGQDWEQRLIGGCTSDHEVRVATDDAANAYATWIGCDGLLKLSASTNLGRTWSNPVTASPADVEEASFPAIAAGADGRIALAYYATNETGPQRTWDAYLTVSTDAASGSPSFNSTTANDAADPVAEGACDSGNRCDGGDSLFNLRNGVGDFIDVTIDDDGRPWGAFVDCQGPTEVGHVDCASDGEDSGAGFVGTLSEGPALRGPLQALDPL